ncbi:MAG: ATP-binding cassette domain-containing protein [Acholeplasmatales bacterium]|nr:ATP-binding cassette domain-containing protein [Acholeplasmatales bacterium]
MEETILKTNGVSKHYGQQKVLDNVSLTINRGDIYGFVGENGAGKTTIIRVITGLISADSGDYELFGISSKNEKELNKVKSKISAIVESPSVYANFNAMDNLLLNQAILGIKDEAKAKVLLDLVGLGNVDMHKKAGNFSLGMRQRLGIAMCLSTDPEFIILDEPLNGLDPEGIVEVRELILKLNKEKNITFMISSHILTELNLVATRFGIISHGKMITEIDRGDIEAAMTKTTKIKTTDNQKAYDLIKDDFEKIELSADEIIVYGDVNVNDLVLKLNSVGVAVVNISTKEASIEDFYLSTMGGSNNA